MDIFRFFLFGMGIQGCIHGFSDARDGIDDAYQQRIKRRCIVENESAGCQ